MAFFTFPYHILKLINRKAQEKNVFWYVILLCYLCSVLCKFLSSKSKATNVFPKHILKSRARDKSIQARKKLFYHVTVKNYLCNVLCKFLIRFESSWTREIKEQTPQLTLLSCGRTVRRSHQRFSIKKLFLIISQYPQETPELETVLKKVTRMKVCNFIKNRQV